MFLSTKFHVFPLSLKNKSKQKQSKTKQKKIKKKTKSNFCWPITPEHEGCHGMWFICHSTEENRFSLSQQLPVEKRLSSDRVSCLLPLLYTEVLFCLSLCRSWAVEIPIGTHVYQSCVQKRLFFWSHLPPLVFTIFLCPLLFRTLSLWGRRTC